MYFWELTAREGSEEAPAEKAEPEDLPFAVDSEFKDGTLFVRIQGRMDTITAPELLKKFQDNRFVKGSFYILRPASTALISAAGFNIILAVFFEAEKITFDMFGQLGEMFTHINWIPIVIFAVVFVLMRIFKKLHPIVFIAACAALGIILKL